MYYIFREFRYTLADLQLLVTFYMHLDQVNPNDLFTSLSDTALSSGSGMGTFYPTPGTKLSPAECCFVFFFLMHTKLPLAEVKTQVDDNTISDSAILRNFVFIKKIQSSLWMAKQRSNHLKLETTKEPETNSSWFQVCDGKFPSHCWNSAVQYTVCSWDSHCIGEYSKSFFGPAWSKLFKHH